MKTLSPRTIREKIAEGWGFTQLADYAECTVEELKSEIENLRGLNREARRAMLRDLKSGEKRYHPKKTDSDANTEALTEQNAAPAEENCLGEQEPQADDDRDYKIAALRTGIQASKEALCNIETTLKNLHASRDSHQHKLGEYRDDLKKIRSRLLELEQKIQLKDRDISAATLRIEEVGRAKSAEEAQLHQLEAELHALEIREIYVSDDGQITNDQNVPYDIPETWGEIFDEIRTSEVAEDCTIREIRTASRVIVLVKNFAQYSVLVESSNVIKLLEASGVLVA